MKNNFERHPSLPKEKIEQAEQELVARMRRGEPMKLSIFLSLLAHGAIAGGATLAHQLELRQHALEAAQSQTTEHIKPESPDAVLKRVAEVDAQNEQIVAKFEQRLHADVDHVIEQLEHGDLDIISADVYMHIDAANLALEMAQQGALNSKTKRNQLLDEAFITQTAAEYQKQLTEQYESGVDAIINNPDYNWTGDLPHDLVQFQQALLTGQDPILHRLGSTEPKYQKDHYQFDAQLQYGIVSCQVDRLTPTMLADIYAAKGLSAEPLQQLQVLSWSDHIATAFQIDDQWEQFQILNPHQPIRDGLASPYTSHEGRVYSAQAHLGEYLVERGSNAEQKQRLADLGILPQHDQAYLDHPLSDEVMSLDHWPDGEPKAINPDKQLHNEYGDPLNDIYQYIRSSDDHLPMQIQRNGFLVTAPQWLQHPKLVGYVIAHGYPKAFSTELSMEGVKLQMILADLSVFDNLNKERTALFLQHTFDSWAKQVESHDLKKIVRYLPPEAFTALVKNQAFMTAWKVSMHNSDHKDDSVYRINERMLRVQSDKSLANSDDTLEKYQQMYIENEGQQESSYYFNEIKDLTGAQCLEYVQRDNHILNGTLLPLFYRLQDNPEAIFTLLNKTLRVGSTVDLIKDNQDIPLMIGDQIRKHPEYQARYEELVQDVTSNEQDNSYRNHLLSIHEPITVQQPNSLAEVQQLRDAVSAETIRTWYQKTVDQTTRLSLLEQQNMYQPVLPKGDLLPQDKDYIDALPWEESGLDLKLMYNLDTITAQDILGLDYHYAQQNYGQSIIRNVLQTLLQVDPDRYIAIMEELDLLEK